MEQNAYWAMPHVEEPTKVNAWVDRGVRSLVEAMNAFPEVLTLDSCEDRKGRAYVYFRVRGATEATPRFVEKLAGALGDSGRAGCDYSLFLEYESGSEPLARITCAHSDAEVLASAVRRCILVAGQAKNLAVG